MLCYHATICSLHGKTKEDSKLKRAKYVELKAELIQHHEQSVKQ